MRKTVLSILMLLVLLSFVSCATKAPQVVVQTASADEWWDNPPADTADYHYEVGYAKGSTVQISRDWAKANANQALAQYINNQIESIVVTYINDAGEVGETTNTQAIQAFESLSKQKAQAILTGVTYKYHTNADNSVYTLAALPIGAFGEELKATVKEAFVKNSASEEANRMMNDAINKYFGGSSTSETVAAQ